MSSAAASKLMTADQLQRRPATPGRCELIQGELRMMSPAGGSHGRIGMRMVGHLDRFIEAQQAGALYLAETGFRLERDPDTVRAADIAFIARDRLAEAETDQFIPIAPDLAVEVNSPHDRAGEVLAKVQWWLAHGTRLVWVVDPGSRTVTAYHPDGAARIVQADAQLDGGDVLPGFTLRVAELFEEGPEHA